jgi:hypothetical protein
MEIGTFEQRRHGALTRVCAIAVFLIFVSAFARARRGNYCLWTTGVDRS